MGSSLYTVTGSSFNRAALQIINKSCIYIRSLYRLDRNSHNDEVHQEMREMKTQLAELKQMMRVSFDLQMDIQRSIRQEVAAALSMFLASPPQVVLQGSLRQGDTAGASPVPCPIPTLSGESCAEQCVVYTVQYVNIL